jgi:hypothetical protein
MRAIADRAVAVSNPIEDLLRELVAGQRRIIELLERRDTTRATPLSRADRAHLARLLPAIGAVLGSELFNSAEICEHEAPSLRLVCAGLSAKQFGRLLRRAADVAIDGYMVERQGIEAGAVLWRVVQVPEFSRNEKVSIPHATRRGLKD